ncbi:hypothetical protein B0H11DRAFT_1377358 [Mycena galericulata]|nr:hypothetical protein B0H11DRAFT_1377358 [Mycena galericulata]
MALAMSPPPQVEFLQEPSPTDSDEDLVPNDPANYKPYSPYTTQRKRKNPGQKTSQPASKRQKSSVATQNFTASMSRATNAVAGSSRRSRSPSSWAVAPSNGRASQPSQSGSSAKTKHSRHTMSRPTENASASSRTKLVRRTRDEKRRQRGSSSDSVPEPTPTLRSLVQNGVSLPPASAPAAPKRQIQDFRREELQKRFAQSTQSAPAKHRKKVTTTTTDIIDLTSDGDPPRRPRSTAKSSRNDPDPDIINVTDSDSESQFIKKSAARKAQKQSGAKNLLPNDREVVTVIDSDDEPPRPVVKPEVVTKSEDAAMGPSGSQVPNNLHRPPSPDFEGHGMDLDANDGVDFGGEDMRDGSPAQSSTLPKTSVFGTHVPPTTPSPPATNENAPLDSMDRLSQSPQRLASPPAVAPTPAIDPCPPSALRGLPAADVSGGDATLPQYGSSETPPLPHTEGAAPKFPSPPQDPNLDLYGMAQSDLRADAPISPDNSTERPMSLFRPNGPLSSHSENPSQDLAPAPAASPSSPLMPSTSTLKPLPRRSFLKGKDIPSHHLSQPSSPYKAIRDVALGTSTLAIQQRLGLQAKGDGNVVPKIDLSTLNVKKKRLSHTPANIPPSLPVDTPQPGPSAEPMAPSISPHAKTQSLRKQSPRSQRDLEAMVDAIITKGQHNAQASTALSQALPRSRPPSSGSQRVSSTPTLQLEETPSGRDSNAQASSAPSQPSCFAPRRPSSPPFVSPVEQRTPLPSSPRPEEAPPGPPNAETSTVSPQPAFLLPCKPSTPPSVPLVGQQKSSIPILKQEEASFGPSVALINDIDDIIDLTISSDDEKAPRAPPRAPVYAILVPTPIPLTQESKEAVQQRNLKKLKRLMSLHGPTVASPSNSSLGPTTKSPPVTDSISAAMDVDASAVGALPSTLNRENELKDKPEGGLDKHAATDDSHRSPSPSPSPLERGLAMDADSLGGIPPQSEQELVNPEAVDGATTVVESVLAGSSPMDVVEPELVPASKPSDTRLTQVNEQPPSPEVDLPWERRSYDDTEVYHLEYIGPPFPAPPGSESEEVAVENLVALSSPGDYPCPRRYECRGQCGDAVLDHC